MKKKYERSISLRCVVCGSSDYFEYNDDKTYVKCTLCNREYLGGQQELQDMNEAVIANEVNSLKKEFLKDAEKELTNMFRKVSSKNKFITFK